MNAGEWQSAQLTLFPFENTGHEFKVIPVAWDEVIAKHGYVILSSHTQLHIYWYMIASSYI